MKIWAFDDCYEFGGSAETGQLCTCKTNFRNWKIKPGSITIESSLRAGFNPGYSSTEVLSRWGWMVSWHLTDPRALTQDDAPAWRQSVSGPHLCEDKSTHSSEWTLPGPTGSIAWPDPWKQQVKTTACQTTYSRFTFFFFFSLKHQHKRELKSRSWYHRQGYKRFSQTVVGDFLNLDYTSFIETFGPTVSSSLPS